MLEIKKNIILAPYTTFRIGGAAKEFAVVKNKEELIEAIKHAKENSEEFFVLGGGSNVLVSDKGFNGLVIKISAKGGSAFGWQDNFLECWAGEKLSDLVNFTAESNLSGLEWAIGIPGTIGGAVRGNAGAYGSEMKDAIECVKVLDTDNLAISEYKKEVCNFNYRTSVFKKKKNLIILSTKLSLKQLEKEKILDKIKEVSKKRSEKIPQGWKGNAGSFFENPTVENQELISEFEKETGTKSADKKIPAGWLIQSAGLSGRKIGNAMVSETNCNFIINIGNGTAEQVIILSSLIKQKVRVSFGVQLKEEVQLIGF
jgi:UDP-N-acetylmuramate dehydrogenase